MKQAHAKIIIFSVVLMKKWIMKTHIDVGEVEDKSDENDESGSAGDEPVEWTNHLCNIHVDDFTLPVGIMFETGNESREIDVFKMFFYYETLNVIVDERIR